MSTRIRIAALVVLAATASWGQNSARPLASRRQTVLASPNSDAQIAAARAKSQAESKQHVDEMGTTLTKMHALLKQMRAKTSASASKDSTAKANLEMWSMMLEQLDKQYEQMLASQKAREDMESRRLTLYKQADEKAAAAAATARAQQAKAAEEARAAAASQPRAAPAPAQSTSTPASTPSATSSPN